MWRWLFYLVVVCAILFVQASVASGSPTAGLIIVVVVGGGLFLVSDIRVRDGVNPLAVYALLAIAAAVAWACLRALSLIGPMGVLAVVVVLGALTTWLTLTRGDALRRRRETMGLCARCGYDLRASPDVCPECGMVVNEELKRRRRIAEELAAKHAEHR